MNSLSFGSIEQALEVAIGRRPPPARTVSDAYLAGMCWSCAKRAFCSVLAGPAIGEDGKPHFPKEWSLDDSGLSSCELRTE